MCAFLIYRKIITPKVMTRYVMNLIFLLPLDFLNYSDASDKLILILI
jgi:hypothetical protein